MIVITDGFTLNPGDLSWDEISKLDKVKLYERTSPDQLVERCQEAAIVVTNKTPLDREAIRQLPSLKMIAVTATGYNIIDTATAKEKGVIVSNVPAYGTYSVAQHSFALILEITNHVGLNAASVQRGEWVSAADWSYTKAPITELAGKTMGIVGMGNIGQQTARIASIFGMKVIYNSRSKKDIDFAKYVSMEELFRESDFISLHCPLTPENNQFVNKSLLSLMKPGAWLVNTARGQLIHEQDLADALNDHRIGGAALDVLSTEPPPGSNPLLKAKNCLITPHNAWSSKEARERIMATTIANIKAFLDGSPVNVVS